MATDDSASDADLEHEDSNRTYETDPWSAQSVIDDHEAYPGHAAKSEGQGDEGLLRIGLRDDDEDLKRVSWEEFREEFEEKDLVLLHSTDGTPVEGDRPLTLVERDDVEQRDER